MDGVAERLSQEVAGRLDTVNPNLIAGWAAIPGQTRPVSVEILLGENIIGTCRADRPRADLAQRGDVSPNAGFEFRCNLTAVDYGARISARVEGARQLLPGSGRFVHALVGARLFFVHIPKTAGSTINRIAALLCPRAQDHLENSDWRDPELFSGYNFLSGHLSSRLPIELYKPRGYHFFTMFREPAEQFVSHLRWVRHYAKLPREQALQLIDPLNYEIACALDTAPADLASQVACLRLLLQNPRLGNAVRPLFDNSLTRYMVTIGAGKAADRADADLARRALDDFDVIGLQSHFGESLAMLQAATGLPWAGHAGRWDNSSPDTEVIGEATAAAGLIESLIWSDQQLYRDAIIRFRRLRLAPPRVRTG